MNKTRLFYMKVLKQRLSPGRLEHSLLVERAAIRLAARHGADWHRAGLAGLLHDICKDAPEAWQLEYLRACGVRPDDAWLANPQIWHGLCGSLYLKRELGIRDRELLRAVGSHTTGRAGMSKLEKLVFLADCLSEDRSFAGIEDRRRTALADLDLAVAQSLAYSVEWVAKNRLPLVRETWEAYNEYAHKLLYRNGANA